MLTMYAAILEFFDGFSWILVVGLTELNNVEWTEYMGSAFLAIGMERGSGNDFLDLWKGGGDSIHPNGLKILRNPIGR